MRARGLASLFAIVLLAAQTQAMDGVSIASIQGGPSYKVWMTTGTLVKYEIKSDLVVKVDTLPGSGFASPRINMSGTYYAALRGIYNGTNKLVFRPLYGNPTAETVITLADSATWFWWLNDGSIMYLTPAFARRDIRKVTLSRSGGKLVVADRMWAKLTYDIQGGFVGISGAGDKTLSMDGLDVHASIMDGDSNKAPTPAYPGGIGCGYSISPSGTYFCQWPGSHNIWGWNRWDGQPMTGGSGGMFFKAFVDSGWVVMGPNDPTKNLEVLYNGVWQKDPLGLCGADNNWSQNSENWYMSELSVGLLDQDGDGFNGIAVNWKERKAINVTKILPVREVMSSRSTFRGVTFTGGTQFSADRPTLWCSTKADVWDSLWQYVENRQADNQKWSDLLGLPLSDLSLSGAKKSGLVNSIPTKAALPACSIVPGGIGVRFPGAGVYSVTAYDATGRALSRMRGAGSTAILPITRAGTYLVEVDQDGTSHAVRFTIP